MSIVRTVHRQQPAGIYPLHIGQTVEAGDWLQIANSFHPIESTQEKLGFETWIGHVIEHGGPFERVWREGKSPAIVWR